MDELLFGYGHFGGHCPQCNSKDTSIWMREVEVPDRYNEWEEWYTCANCKHTWKDDSVEAANTYLLNNGYTQDDIDSFMDRAMRIIEQFRKSTDDSE